MKDISNMRSMDIVVLGMRGFPDSFSAKVNRYRSVTSMLTKAGNSVVVLNREIGKKKWSGLPSGVIIESCLHTGLSSYTLRKVLRYFLFLFEFGKLFNWSMNRKGKKLFIVYTSSLSLFTWYVFVSKVLNVRIVYDYVEKRTEIKERYQNKRKLFQDKLFEHYALKWNDGFFVISGFLEKEVQNRFSSKPCYKLPPVCDFKYFRQIKTEPTEPYILYCGSYGYKDVIDFVVDAYRKANVSEALSLYLVINGGLGEIETLKSELKNFPAIKIFTRLDYTGLIKMYKGAKALMIPLRNVVHDYARFPQKICEYSASEGLIVSTEIGEMVNYFEHEESALLAKSYEAHLYADLIKKITADQEKCEVISERGWQIGLKYFSEESLYTEVSNFLEKV
ncbi:MAG: glycosyltransferase [Marinilabiliaceae bacterium]|nr:glycosyltransferase [Marinilabiliaceae bacterium]